MDEPMQCQQVEDRFEEHFEGPLQEVAGHLARCEQCRRQWDGFAGLMEQLAGLKATPPGPEFDLKVLATLEARGLFEEEPSLLERWLRWTETWLPRAALAACVLLILWMVGLAGTRPPEELRALTPEKARAWTHLPDAVPPPAFPGPAPSQKRVEVVVTP